MESSINRLNMASKHQNLILDQFTRQAVPFSTAAAIRNEEALNRIVNMAGTGPDDTVLDVACGPGLLTCAFARFAGHATGIDCTPAMLDQAREFQRQQKLVNLTWQQGDVVPLPYEDGSFSIVGSRFALHHLLDPLAALREMRRVCKPGGRIVVADSAPAAGKSDAFNAMERLRDPSHVQAFPLEQLRAMFRDAGLPDPRVDMYRLEGELEGLLERSFPAEGDADRIRRIFEDSVVDNALDMNTRREDGKIFFSYPVAILVSP
jgi:ubiquinone/menaquinone biosynthesis C-methylase UbiE